jgi:MFS family permease
VSEPPTRTPRLGTAAELALAVTIAITVMNMTLIVPVIPAFANEFGVTLAAAAAMVSVFAAGRFFFRFWGGLGADRFGARRVAVVGALSMAGGAAVAAAAPVFWLVLAARAVQGIGGGALGVAANQYLLRMTPQERLGRAMAVFQTGIVAGAAIGPLIGGVLADLGDLRTPFWAQTIVGVALIPLIAASMSDESQRVRSIGASLRLAGGLLRRPVFLGVMFLGFALFFLRAGARNALLPAYADIEAGLGPAAIGAVVGASSLTSVAVMIPTGRLVDRVGRKPVMMAGVVAVAASVALYATTTSLWGLLAVSALAGLTVGLASVPLPTMVGDLAPEGTEGVAAGVFRMANDLGWIVGPLVLGAMADGGLWALGFVVAGVPLLVAGLLFLGAPETLRR